MIKKKIIISLALIILIISASFLIIKFSKGNLISTNLMSATQQSRTQPSRPDAQVQSTGQQQYIPNQLKQLSDLKLFKDREGFPANLVQYYEVQDVEYNGAKLIVAVDGYCDGAGCSPSYYRFLGNEKIFTLLTKYSAPTDGSYGLLKTDLNTSLTSDMNIPALNMPALLQDPKTKANVKQDVTSSQTGNFFNPQNKILMFTADGYEVFSANDGSQFDIFYIQAADGKELAYKLIDPFINNQAGEFNSSLDIKWADGQIHNNDFQIDPTFNSTDDSLSICEVGQDYFNAVSSTTVSQNDLTLIGTNASGQPIYGFRDLNNPILKAAQIKITDEKKHNDPADIIIFWNDPFGRLIRFVSSDMFSACGGKPVIYLYPTKPSNIEVRVAPAGGIFKSEPTYKNGWTVFAQPDGTITLGDQQYPYLFWEGGLDYYKMPEKGFVVARAEIKQFLDDKMALIGLNAQEIKDFEEFWLPKMQSAPFYFITFIINSDVDKLAPLFIKPKPDTIIRVLMDYKSVNENTVVQEQKLPKINRNGFTVVEWGGILK